MADAWVAGDFCVPSGDARFAARHLVVYLQPSASTSWDDEGVMPRRRRVFPVRRHKAVASQVLPGRHESVLQHAAEEPDARVRNRIPLPGCLRCGVLALFIRFAVGECHCGGSS